MQAVGVGEVGTVDQVVTGEGNSAWDFLASMVLKCSVLFLLEQKISTCSVSDSDDIDSDMVERLIVQ